MVRTLSLPPSRAIQRRGRHTSPVAWALGNPSRRRRHRTTGRDVCSRPKAAERTAVPSYHFHVEDGADDIDHDALVSVFEQSNAGATRRLSISNIPLSRALLIV